MCAVVPECFGGQAQSRFISGFGLAGSAHHLFPSTSSCSASASPMTTFSPAPTLNSRPTGPSKRPKGISGVDLVVDDLDERLFEATMSPSGLSHVDLPS